MCERLWTAVLTAEQLNAWLAPPRTRAPFAVLERLTDVDFPAPDEQIDSSAWMQGRIFGPDFELRWERQGEEYRAWLCGQFTAMEELAESGFEAELLNLGQAQILEERSYLWGSSEVRIGRHLSYRALGHARGRPQLMRRNFWAKGELVIYRYAGMKWEET